MTPVERKEYLKEYYAKHKPKMNKKARAWIKKNKAKRSEHQKRYRLKRKMKKAENGTVA